MQPSTLTKPVMDVAVPPKGPLPDAPATAVASLPVQPTPPQTASFPASSAASLLKTPDQSSKKAPTATANRKPTALITVTLFVMLVLSVLAVTVFVTTKTA